MRELKFRAWLKKYNCYAEVLGFDRGKLIVHLQRGELVEHRLHIPIEDCILEQFTGLKNKNGKEIYDGDIVDDGFSCIYEVRWSEYFTKFEAVNEERGCAFDIWFVTEYGEVIGNIHENPELLGDTNVTNKEEE